MNKKANRTMQIVVPTLVVMLVIAVFVAVRPSSENGDGDETGNSPSKSTRSTPLPSARASEALHHLLRKEPEPGDRFEEFEQLASSLNDAALLALIEQVGVEGDDGYRAWTRSALFAEWARRDLEAALAYLVEHRSRNRAGQPVLYALFAGTRPTEPEAALKYLRSLHNDPRFRLEKGGTRSVATFNADWVKTAYRRIFTELSATNPEQAWSYLPGREREENEDPYLRSTSESSYNAMVAGFFAGLPDAETTRAYVERFGPAGGPGTESTAIRIGAAWMEHDFNSALQWSPPMRNEPGVAELIGGVRGNVVWYWARRNPETALAALRANSLPDWNNDIANQVLRHNAHLAPELAEFLSTRTSGDERPLARIALHNAIGVNSRLNDRELFPEAGRFNRPPDYRARYESLQAALQHTVFSPEDRAHLQGMLDQAFARHLAPDDEASDD